MYLLLRDEMKNLVAWLGREEKGACVFQGWTLAEHTFDGASRESFVHEKMAERVVATVVDVFWRRTCSTCMLSFTGIAAAGSSCCIGAGSLSPVA